MNKVQNHDFPLTVSYSFPIRVRVFKERHIIQVIQLKREEWTLPQASYAIRLMDFLKEQCEKGDLEYYKLHQENPPLDFSKKSSVRLQFLPYKEEGEARSAFYFYRDENNNFTCEKVMPEDILPWDNVMPEDILP